MRPCIPKKLRPMVLHNEHSSVWGGDTRVSRPLTKQVAAQYLWPEMEKDVRKFVSECEACQLAKGTKPHRHGMSLGHKYTEPGAHLCLDLVAEIR